jgi:hypothetical protein
MKCPENAVRTGEAVVVRNPCSSRIGSASRRWSGASADFSAFRGVLNFALRRYFDPGRARIAPPGFGELLAELAFAGVILFALVLFALVGFEGRGFALVVPVALGPAPSLFAFLAATDVALVFAALTIGASAN